MTFRALGRNHIVSTRFNAITMLGFNYTVGFPETVTVLSSSLIVARSPRKDIASTLQKKPSSRSRRLRRILQSNRRAIPPSRTSSDYSKLRANSFPKVTNLFCRLPLLALSHRPETTHLGNRLRISVRLCMNINHSVGFSRVNAD